MKTARAAAAAGGAGGDENGVGRRLDEAGPASLARNKCQAIGWPSTRLALEAAHEHGECGAEVGAMVSKRLGIVR